MPTFHTVEHDDFGSWVGLCRNKSTVGNSTEVIINNPFSTTNISEPTLQNYIDINTGLTPIHSCVVGQNDARRIIRDSHNNILNGPDRGPMDEMVLMGRLVQDSTGKTNFTYSIDDVGTPCDGFAQIIQPSWGTWNETTRWDQTIADHDQFSMRTNLQFADLDPFTWVPVFGVTYGAGMKQGEPVHFDDNLAYPGSAIDYRNETANYGYKRPDGLSKSATNLYGTAWGSELGDGYMDHSHTWYIVYCHDGNGNGMLASCLGMSATGMKYVQSGSTGYVSRDMAASNAHWATHHGKFKYVPNTILQNLFTTHGNNLQTIWDHYGTNEYGGGRRIVQHSQGSTTGHDSTADPLFNGRHNIYGNISLIAYGPTANSALSSPENIYVNHIKLRNPTGPSTQGYRVTKYGSYYDGANDSIGTVYHRYVTGKVGDLIFYNHPTMWTIGREAENGWYSAPTCSRFILHATHLGKCKINDFSIGAYTPTTSSTRRATSGVLNGYDMPYSNMEYIFPGAGVTYNPVSELSSSSSFIDTGNAWTAEINMFDATADTFTTVDAIGTSNALHIPLNGVSGGNTTPNDLDPVEEFSINIRGIKQQDIKEYEIVFALTDSDRVTLVTATEHQRVSVTESAGGTIDTSTKYPLSESSYMVTFKASDASIKYGDIKDGYLKMYVVEKTGTNA